MSRMWEEKSNNGMLSKGTHIRYQMPSKWMCIEQKQGTKALTLNDLIKHYGGIEMFDRWCRARGQFHYKNTWNPIKNRRVGEKSSRRKKSFRERMNLKSTVLMTKVRAGKFTNPDS